VKTAFFMIEIILGVFSIPLYIIKKGKLKKTKNVILAWGWIPETISATSFGQNKISTNARFIM
jgi:hypothetical protein